MHPPRSGASHDVEIEETIPGGDHGGFTLEENLEAMRVIRDFLREHGILGSTTTSSLTR